MLKGDESSSVHVFMHLSKEKQRDLKWYYTDRVLHPLMFLSNKGHWSVDGNRHGRRLKSIQWKIAESKSQ